ncbi:hypothetical protein [Nostoc sphaeroides]|uniref:Uncharacterized protein n=1 Tax=Nostoc sphaeroides CCNUC1 TaxID=2653204 RepID=A0A5P8WCK4_9NOSO|nr:hypothetical protein [Nostoc sphaeroides]QFS50543.1 hypothetical protein GXM_08037 [Nostoc sphaeroides CCNUC1]
MFYLEGDLDTFHQYRSVNKISWLRQPGENTCQLNVKAMSRKELQFLGYEPMALRKDTALVLTGSQYLGS